MWGTPSTAAHSPSTRQQWAVSEVFEGPARRSCQPPSESRRRGTGSPRPRLQQTGSEPPIMQWTRSPPMSVGDQICARCVRRRCPHRCRPPGDRRARSRRHERYTRHRADLSPPGPQAGHRAALSTTKVRRPRHGPTVPASQRRSRHRHGEPATRSSGSPVHSSASCARAVAAANASAYASE